MYFQEHISTTASGTDKFNLLALTILKLKMIYDFLPCITFYTLSMKM